MSFTLCHYVRWKQWSEAADRLQQYPQEAKPREGTQWNGSVLEDAINNQAPTALLMALLNTYPRAVRRTNCSDDYPTFWACVHGVDPTVMEGLLLAFPDVLDMKRRITFHQVTLLEAAQQYWTGDPDHQKACIELIEKGTEYWVDRAAKAKKYVDKISTFCSTPFYVETENYDALQKLILTLPV